MSIMNCINYKSLNENLMYIMYNVLNIMDNVFNIMYINLYVY